MGRGQEIDKDFIRGKLNTSLRRYSRRVQQLEEETAPIAPDCAIGRVSRMDAINNKGVNEAALFNARNKLRDTKEALARLDSADFGNCKSCSEKIPHARIIAMPESLYCMKCAKK